MKKNRTPWAQKLRPEMQPQTCPDPKGRGTMLLPTPMLIAAAINQIPKGKITYLSQFRNQLAAENKADITCPLMMGIFYNIIAGATEENLRNHQQPLAPYWRIIPDNHTLSPKTPDGPAIQAAHLTKEGHTLTHTKDKWKLIPTKI